MSKVKPMNSAEVGGFRRWFLEPTISTAFVHRGFFSYLFQFTRSLLRAASTLPRWELYLVPPLTSPPRRKTPIFLAGST